MEATLIEKETIPSLKFNDKSTVEQHPDILKQIEKATILGNAHRTKVSIFFRDDESVKRVETTIWAAGTKFICLKGGVWIPISRLIEVKI
jgi:sensor histidine kinase regulating citrate/malate metabolism